MKVQPLGDRVLVEVLEAEEKTKGGIVLPDTAKEKPQQALVVAVGKGKTTNDGKFVAPEVKTGDIVLFGKYSGTELKVEEKNMLMLKEEDILARIKKSGLFALRKQGAKTYQFSKVEIVE